MELNEKDLHCMARMLQGQIYEKDMLFCCRGYCKYSKECEDDFKNKRKSQYYITRNKIEKVLGIYMGYLLNPDYVYQKMVKNSYFEANGIDPFKENPEINCPQYAADWKHAKGLKEKASRFRSMLKIEGRKTAFAVRALIDSQKSFVTAYTELLIHRLKKKKEKTNEQKDL